MNEAEQLPDADRLLDVDGVAGLLAVSPTTVYRMVRAGHLRAYRFEGGARLRFRRDDVLASLVPVNG